MKRKAVVTTHA